MSSVQFVKDSSLPSSWGTTPLLSFFQSLRWEKESAADLKAAAKAGDWEALKAALLPEVVASLDELTYALPVDEWPWTWSLNGEQPSPAVEKLLAALRKLTNTARAELARPLANKQRKTGKSSKSAELWNDLVLAWLEAQNCAPCSTIDRLLWLDLFPLLAPHLSGELFCSLWKKLFIEAALVSASILSAKGKQRPAPSTQELAWRYSLIFWSVLGGDRVQALASAMLERALGDETDDLGTPEGEVLENLSNWLAPFVRASREAQRAGVTLLNEPGQLRFRRVTHRALALCTDNGNFLLSRSSLANPQSFLKQLLKAGDESVADFLLSAFPALNDSSRRRSSAKSPRGACKPGSLPSVLGNETEVSPRASFQSDEMSVACLRNYFSKGEAKIAIAHHLPNPLIELYADGVSFLKGSWTSSIHRGKKSSTHTQPGFNTCWNTDEDSEYFEMRLDLTGGGQLDRQILMPRKGHYAIFAEAVTKLPAGRFEHEMRIPVPPGLKIEQDQKTREYRLIGDNLIARFFPLTLPQSKIDSTPGSITVEDRELVIRTVAEGNGLYVPFVLDWDRSRTHASAVWRTLTVTENLEAVRRDVAAGFRLKLDQQHQLLLYRSLKHSWEPRACLGFQTRYETAIARLNPNGEILPLMYVE